MTIQRELKLKRAGNNIYVASEPVDELRKIQMKKVTAENIFIDKDYDISEKTGNINLPCQINLSTNKLKDFSLSISNDKEEKIIVGYNKKQNQYFIDRTHSGKHDFHKDFAATHVAPRLGKSDKVNLTLVIDVSSVELFGDNGLSV